jgi:hypothetical protein
MTSTSKTILKYEGTKEIIDRLLSKGYTNPSVVESESNIQTITNTDKTNSSNTFNIQFEINQSKDSQTRNGEIVEKENSELKNIKLFGHCSVGAKTKIDSVTGENINESLKNLFIQTFGSLNDVVSFPEKCLKVGDTFSQESPIEMPMAGSNPIKLNVTTKYTLIKKENKLAFFDIEQIYKLTNSSEKTQVEISVKGTGKGNVTVDTENNYLTYYESKTNLDFDMKAGDLTIKMEQIATTIQRIQISRR